MLYLIFNPLYQIFKIFHTFKTNILNLKLLKIKLIFLPQLCIVMRQHRSDKCTVHTFSGLQ